MTGQKRRGLEKQGANHEFSLRQKIGVTATIPVNPKKRDNAGYYQARKAGKAQKETEAVPIIRGGGEAGKRKS